MKTNRIPFSLEKYESGKYKVVTKNGRKARIICTDFKSEQPIIAIVEEENDKESFSDFALDGKLWIGGRVSNTDLYLEETVFKDGDILSYSDNSRCVFIYKSGGMASDFYCGITSSGKYLQSDLRNIRAMNGNEDKELLVLASEEQKDRLFSKMEMLGKRWNAETKQVEMVCKFNPFDKVLGRDNEDEQWMPDFFRKYDLEMKYPHRCMCDNYKQCIPYEGNEELLGTINSPKK